MDTVHSAITEPVRRLEVFTGAGRRRKWNDEDKARIGEEEDRRRQGEMFTLIYGIWTFLFQVGVLALLSVIAWKLW
jgi:hypothetical protein